MTKPCDEQHVWELLGNVADPEIPALSVVDLGIVRHIQWNDAKFIITVTPTYAGCPAMTMIESDIQKALESEDIPSTITRILAPAWTTAWLSDSARAKLVASGIAPSVEVEVHVPARGIVCPHCGARETERLTSFGSTACKALYRCLACGSPFDYFKPL